MVLLVFNHIVIFHDKKDGSEIFTTLRNEYEWEVAPKTGDAVCIDNGKNELCFPIEQVVHRIHKKSVHCGISRIVFTDKEQYEQHIQNYVDHEFHVIQ